MPSTKISPNPRVAKAKRGTGTEVNISVNATVRPKPMYLLWPITTDTNNTINQSEFEANPCRRRQARENACEQVTIGFAFAFHWLRSGASLTNQSQNVVKQTQITFDTQLKTALYIQMSEITYTKHEFDICHGIHIICERQRIEHSIQVKDFTYEKNKQKDIWR